MLPSVRALASSSSFAPASRKLSAPTARAYASAASAAPAVPSDLAASIDVDDAVSRTSSASSSASAAAAAASSGAAASSAPAAAAWPRNIADFRGADIRALKVSDYASADGRYIAIVATGRGSPYWTVGKLTPTDAAGAAAAAAASGGEYDADATVGAPAPARTSSLTVDFPVVPARSDRGEMRTGANDKMDLSLRVAKGDGATLEGVDSVVAWCTDAVHAVRAQAFRNKSVKATEAAMALAHGDAAEALAIDVGTTRSWCGSPLKAGAAKTGGDASDTYDPTLRVKVTGWARLAVRPQTATSHAGKTYLKGCDYLPRVWNADAAAFSPPLGAEDTTFLLCVGVGDGGKLLVIDKTPVVAPDGRVLRDGKGRVLRRAISPADAPKGTGVIADVKLKIHIGADTFTPVLTAIRVVLFPRASGKAARDDNAALAIVDADDVDAALLPATDAGACAALALTAWNDDGDDGGAPAAARGGAAAPASKRARIADIDE